MKRCDKNTKLKRPISILIVLALLSVYAFVIPASAAGCGVAMYIPSAANQLSGVVKSWEGTDTMKPGYPDVLSDSTKQIETESGNYWKAGYGVANIHRYNPQRKTVTVRYPVITTADNDSSDYRLYINGGVDTTPGVVTHMAVGVAASEDCVLEVYHAQEDGVFRGERCGVVQFKKGFHEYLFPVSASNNTWNTDNTIYGWGATVDWDGKGPETQMNVLHFAMPGSVKGTRTVPLDLEYSYVRFVNTDYDGMLMDAGQFNDNATKIENGASDYSVDNNIVDFEFIDDLDLSTVTEDNVKINGKPVAWVMTADSSTTLFRADLGELKKNQTYTVSFSGVKTKDGANVTEEFTFSTPAVADAAEPVSAVMRKADTTTGVIGGWEGTEGAKDGETLPEAFVNTVPIKTKGGEWAVPGHNRHRYNRQRGTVQGRFPVLSKENDDSDMRLHLDQGIPTDAGVTHMIIGVEVSEDCVFEVYHAQDGGDYRGERGGVVKFKKGFHEYNFPVSGTNNPWTIDNTIYGWGSTVDWDGKGPETQVDLLRFALPGGTRGSRMIPLDIEFAYIRFVTDDYTGTIQNMNAGTDITPQRYSNTYNADNNIVDFEFNSDLDISGIEPENVMLNGIPASWIMTDVSNKKGFRAYFASMEPIMRNRLDISGIRNADSARLTVNGYQFTTAPKEDTSGKSAPIMSWELVENYKTENEAVLTANTPLAGKTITAVTGGLYNNSNTVKKYALVLARYKDDRIVACEFTPKTLNAYEMIGEQTVEMTVPDDGNTYTVKAFAIDYENVDLLCRSVTPSDSRESKPLKVLILGNSITYHEPADWLSWNGYWGMAASSMDKDYVHLLTKSIKEKYPLLQEKHQNISKIEDSFFNNINTMVKENPEYKECADFEADIIILTIGANIHPSEEHLFNTEKYGEIINAFKTNPNARVIIGATPLTGDDVKSVLSEYASDNNLSYVDMYFNPDTNPEYFPTADEQPNEGVRAHPNDAGMKAMADKLEPALWRAIESYHTK